MDALIVGFDRALRTLSGVFPVGRPSPAKSPEGVQSESDRRLAVALMRVNHSGEVCAQALYQAQAAFSVSASTRLALKRSAEEEFDHLRWTADRLLELGGRRSLFDPFWYVGAFGIGGMAAGFGDAANLGFLKETERQVVQHLNRHLDRLPVADERSREVLRQMSVDESAHADLAGGLGGADLPLAVAVLMRLSARVMTTLAYRL